MSDEQMTNAEFLADITQQSTYNLTREEFDRLIALARIGAVPLTAAPGAVWKDCVHCGARNDREHSPACPNHRGAEELPSIAAPGAVVDDEMVELGQMPSSPVDRIGGPNGHFKCRRPSVIQCRLWECQEHGVCTALNGGK